MIKELFEKRGVLEENVFRWIGSMVRTNKDFYSSEDESWRASKKDGIRETIDMIDNVGYKASWRTNADAFMATQNAFRTLHDRKKIKSIRVMSDNTDGDATKEVLIQVDMLSNKSYLVIIDEEEVRISSFDKGEKSRLATVDLIGKKIPLIGKEYDKPTEKVYLSIIKYVV